MNRRQQEFNDVLFAWNDEHYRVMPWRTKRRDSRKLLDPYSVLVSELMLQQTQVARVRIKYDAFLQAFPDVVTLASAPLKDVLRLWTGLGYNRRAKYLHETARIVVNTFGGKFPQNFEQLCTLPGVGPSTAAGIMAFSWNAPYPMIDTNLRRILKRCFFRGENVSDKELFLFATAMIPKNKARAWNYAMLDLGALACTAKKHSANCPFFDFHGDIEEHVKSRKGEKFEHSRRYVRGRIISVLSEKDGVAISDISERFNNQYHDIKDIVSDLVSEGLIVLKSKKLYLAE